MEKQKNGQFLRHDLRKARGIIALVGIILVVLLILPELARADAWWGEGYRQPEWVKTNGGTIVYYSIKGKKSSDKYKARMYQGSKRIEIEYGSSGVFDDAKSGTYSISAHEGSKKIGTVNFSACPGGTLYANFDVKKKTGSISGCRKRAPKKIKKTPAVAETEKESLVEEEVQIKEETETSGEKTENISRPNEKISIVSWNDLFHSFFMELFKFDFLSRKK